MNSVLFGEMDKVFSLPQKIFKILEKSGTFVSPEKWEPWSAVSTRVKKNIT